MKTLLYLVEVAAILSIFGVICGLPQGIWRRIQRCVWRRRFFKAFDVAPEGPLVQTFVDAQIRDLRKRIGNLEERLATTQRLLEDKMKEHQEAIKAAFAYKEMAQALEHAHFDIGNFQGGIELIAEDLTTMGRKLRNQERSAQALGFTIPTPPQP